MIICDFLLLTGDALCLPCSSRISLNVHPFLPVFGLALCQPLIPLHILRLPFVHREIVGKETDVWR